jgi:hypothetical protein
MVDGFLALAASFFLSPNTVYESGSTPVYDGQLFEDGMPVNETAPKRRAA